MQERKSCQLELLSSDHQIQLQGYSTFPPLPFCKYRGSHVVTHWLIDQFWLIDQISMELIGLSSNDIHLVNGSICLFDQFLAAKTAYR